MADRRTFLSGVAVAVTAGCLDTGGSSEPDDGREEPTDGGADPDPDPSYHLRAAPVEIAEREPVLSTEEAAVAEIEPLVELLAEVKERLEVRYASLSAADAEAFEELTADVERYAAGNPPGYYIDHEGLVISVTISG
jgi:hypothetical protein